MRLDSCPLGVEVEVVSLDVPTVAQLRLREVGVRVGTTVRITNTAPFGGRVVAVGASRIAIDRATAALIGVAAVAAVPALVP